MQINVRMIYDHQFSQKIVKMYDEIGLSENEEDDAIDNAGYTGNFRRAQSKSLEAITEKEFMKILKNDNQLKEIMGLIQQIDKDRNGYVTSTELDDILKILYPKELGQKNLKNLLRPFCSSANKVLIDYKLFRSFLQANLERKEGDFKNSAEYLKALK